MKKKTAGSKKAAKGPDGITAITVGGFKSIVEPTRIEIRPLTILAGANSSGKSSIMQPLLLLKQTLEASFDPGPLLLDGPNVRFTSVDQLLSKGTKGTITHTFHVGIETGDFSISFHFEKKRNKRGFIIQRLEYVSEDNKIVVRPDMKIEETLSLVPQKLRKIYEDLKQNEKKTPKWSIARNRFFLGIILASENKKGAVSPLAILAPDRIIEPYISRLIHLPGLRGNPERAYPSAVFMTSFPGTFEHYAASVIANWEEVRDDKLSQLATWLETLGLTWGIEAKYIDDTRIELRVGRSPKRTRASRKDMVSLADVGFGVSQVLPVLVALLEAEPGQMVYLEQPEIHLHPRAKKAMAQILVEAAKRGVRIVAETHSSLLLRGIQTLVAKGEIDPEMIKLHWFQRNHDDGMTTVTSADMKKDGAVGDWPVDFTNVIIETENEYLNAS
ncbi:MAG: AAA family ATPase [Deltaproteobacteria bacterium]|nr:AAA family ATPase [Deltaproteobacteria bacterium]